MFHRTCLIVFSSLYLKDTEGLFSSEDIDGRLVSHNVEADRLAERTALSNSNNIPVLDRKCRRAVHSNVLVPFLETPVLGNVVQVVPADNNGALHLGANNKSLEDASTDGDIASKRALFVHIVALNGSGRSLDSETDRLGETHGLLDLSTNGTLACHKDGILALVGLFVLIALNVILCNPHHLTSVIEKDLYKQRGNGQDKGSVLSLFGILVESLQSTIERINLGRGKAKDNNFNARKEPCYDGL